MFQSRREQRGEQQDGICPLDLLEFKNNVERLNFWLSRFVVEARCEDGNFYPPATIHNLLSGGSVALNFMNSLNPAFRDLGEHCKCVTVNTCCEMKQSTDLACLLTSCVCGTTSTKLKDEYRSHSIKKYGSTSYLRIGQVIK